MNKVAINTDGTLTSVVIDGVDYSKKASKVVFEHEAGAIPVVSITLPVDEVEITGVVGSVIMSERDADNGMANAWVNALVSVSPENADEITPEHFSSWLQNEVKQAFLKVLKENMHKSFLNILKEQLHDEAGKSFDY